MNHQEWRRLVPDQHAYRRAGGRRAWNARRQIQQLLRRQQVAKLLRAGRSRGEMAQALVVHPSTISRDLAALQAQGPLLRPYRR
jgi:hypothetical protein